MGHFGAPAPLATGLTPPAAYMKSMNATDHRARTADGRFTFDPGHSPDVDVLADHAPATYSVIAEELNAGDTILVDGALHTINETWILSIEPETLVASTDDGDLRFDREDRIDVVRTGDEPNPEDADGYVGACYLCGEPFGEDSSALTFHIHPRGGTDYEADRHHVPYGDVDVDDIISQFGEGAL